MFRFVLCIPILLAANAASAQTNIALDEVEAPSRGVAGTEVDVRLEADLDTTSPVNDLDWEVLLVPGVDLDRAVVIASGSFSSLGGAKTIDASATLPADRVGLWRLAGRLDGDDDVEESNEFDNVAFAPDSIRIDPPTPDFIVDQVEVTSNEVRPSDALTVEARIRNRGSAEGSATARAVLSSGELPTGDDPEIGDRPITLAPGEELFVALDGAVPDLPTGRYRVGVRLDVGTPDANPADDAAVAPGRVTLVKDSLTLITDELLDGVVGFSYFATLAADGGDGVFDYTVVSGGLPPGLRIEASTIVGTPRASGTYPFELEVESRGFTDRAAYELEILQTEGSLSVVTSTLPAGRLQVSYGHVLVAGGGERPYTWEVVDGQLPDGIELRGDELGGTPSAVGTFPFALRVTDRLGAEATRGFAIAVSTSNKVLVDPEPLPVGAAGIEYEAQLGAAGGVPPYRWRALSDLPVGLNLSSTGRVFGTPGRPGDFVFRVEVTDATDRGISDRSLIYLPVEDADNFGIRRPEVPVLRFGNRFELVFRVDGGVRPYAWSLAPGSRLPRNTFFSNGEGDRADAGVMVGAPSELGTFGVGIVVEDGQGRRRETELALRVERAGTTSDAGGCRGTSAGGTSAASLALFVAVCTRLGVQSFRRRGLRGRS